MCCVSETSLTRNFAADLSSSTITRFLGKVWLEILVANLATNFQDLVANVKNLVAFVPVLGAILRPACGSLRDLGLPVMDQVWLSLATTWNWLTKKNNLDNWTQSKAWFGWTIDMKLITNKFETWVTSCRFCYFLTTEHDSLLAEALFLVFADGIKETSAMGQKWLY